MWDSNPKSLVSKIASCSLSQDEIPIPKWRTARGCERHLSLGREPRVHPFGHALGFPERGRACHARRWLMDWSALHGLSLVILSLAKTALV